VKISDGIKVFSFGIENV